jgi:uncharacterized protein
MSGDEPSLSDLLAAVRRAVAPVAEVSAALVFGSRARGRARADSDIDVGILLGGGLGPSDRKAQLARLFRALGKELAADRLDVVILNEASPALAFQVLEHGAVAFERNPAELHRFRVLTYRRHADYEPVERLFREATRRRALGEAHGRG